MAIREWIVTIAVISLVIERVIRWIFRFIRPEKEIDKIAMEMVKLHTKSVGEGWDSTPLALFYFYKQGLKRDLRIDEDFAEWIQERERKINEKLEDCENCQNKNLAIIRELNSLFYELKNQGRLPGELIDFLHRAEVLFGRNSDIIRIRENKIKEIVSKFFGKKNKN